MEERSGEKKRWWRRRVRTEKRERGSNDDEDEEHSLISFFISYFFLLPYLTRLLYSLSTFSVAHSCRSVPSSSYYVSSYFPSNPFSFLYFDPFTTLSFIKKWTEFNLTSSFKSYFLSLIFPRFFHTLYFLFFLQKSNLHSVLQNHPGNSHLVKSVTAFLSLFWHWKCIKKYSK